MVTKNPKISWTRCGLVRGRWYIIWIAETYLQVRIQQPGQLIVVKTEQLQIKLCSLKFR